MGETEKKKPSWQAGYHHYRKWSNDGSLERVWQGSIMTISQDVDLQHMNLDGSHAIAKKGGEAVTYQGRKRAKTSNVLPITDANGYVVASTGIVAGNHHDSFNLKAHLNVPSSLSSTWACPLLAATSMPTALLIRMMPVKSASITRSFPTSLKTSVIAKLPSADVSAFSILPSINVAFPANGLLLGLTSFVLYSFVLTIKWRISWLPIILPLLLSTYAISLLRKFESVPYKKEQEDSPATPNPRLEPDQFYPVLKDEKTIINKPANIGDIRTGYIALEGKILDSQEPYTTFKVLKDYPIPTPAKTSVANIYKLTDEQIQALRRNDGNMVYIGRENKRLRLPASKWAITYRIDKEHTREQVIAENRAELLKNKRLLQAIPELRGNTLVCYCHELPCHGDTLAELANMPDAELQKLIVAASEPKQPIDQPVKDAIAQWVQEIDPKLAGSLAGVLSGKASGVWKRHLDKPKLTAEELAAVARSIKPFVDDFRIECEGCAFHRVAQKLKKRYSVPSSSTRTRCSKSKTAFKSRTFILCSMAGCTPPCLPSKIGVKRLTT
jgi:hypothetical protein